MSRRARLIFLAVALPALASAQAELPSADFVTIDRLTPGASGEAAVEVILRVLSSDGEPIADLRPADLRVWQSDEPVETSDLSLSLVTDSRTAGSSVFVLDRSSAMAGDAFDRSVQTALNFVERAGRGEEVGVVAFDSEVEVIVPFGSPQRDARRSLEALTPGPGSGRELTAAVLAAIDLLRSDSRHAEGFVVLLSRGGAGGGRGATSRVAEASIGREGEARIPVFALAGPATGAQQLGLLRELAEETSGSFSQVTPRDFNSVVNRIWRQMAGRYRLRFPAEMDGRRHRVDIEIEGKVASAKVAYPQHEFVLPWTLLAWLGAGLGLVAIVAASVVIRGRPRPARLVILTGTQAGNVITLGRGAHKIGSLPDNPVHLPSAGVSRHHAEISVDDEKVQIRDLQSKNGTRVNGVLRELSPLLPGDKIEFADIQVVFERGPKTKERKTSER